MAFDLKRAIIFDAQDSGHHREFLEHLIDAGDGFYDGELVYAVSEQMAGILSPKVEGIILRTVPISNKVGLSLYDYHLRWLVSLAEELKVEFVFFMHLDPYQMGIGKRWFRSTRIKTAGILFAPPHRIKAEAKDGIHDRILIHVLKRRKKMQLQWMLRNPYFSRAFILDDSNTKNILGCRKSNFFGTLPDPLQPKPSDLMSDSAFRLRNGLRKDSKILLAFGAINSRKNLVKICEALRNWNGPQVSLLVVGRVSTDYLDELDIAMAQLKREPHVEALLVNSIVEDKFMHEVFCNSDVILANYPRFYFSSGVVGRALQYGKLVLGPSHGLISWQIKKFNVGVTVENDVDSIRAGLIEITGKTLELTDNLKDWIQGKSPEAFARKIFNEAII